MAFDGIVVSALVKELKEHLEGGRINKIAQPEKDELLFTVKQAAQERLLICAGASLPLVYLTQENKLSPLTAPNFCMLLRKHIGGGRIISVTQPGLERIIRFEISHLNDLGDLCRKFLIVELMGKHSNVIFCDDTDKIIDSMKHISNQVSSVREVLPGRQYFIPDTMQKKDPLAISEQEFNQVLKDSPLPLSKALYSSFTGISPVIAKELCYRAFEAQPQHLDLEENQPANEVSQEALSLLYTQLSFLMQEVKAGQFSPVIIHRKREPVEFSAVFLHQYGDLTVDSHDSISEVLQEYYAEKSVYTRIRQKSFDLRRIVQTALERNRKKYDLQLRQMKDTEKRDKYKVYGELIHTYGHGVEEGSESFSALNYYTNETIRIPLESRLTPMENAKKYFERYNKMKRTYEALSELTKTVHDEITHLESIAAALDIALSEEDLVQIKAELTAYGYIKSKGHGKKEKIKSKPFHYISTDGFHMYVGKNNFQNDELTFSFANGEDWWFHAKGIPGSHVIVKTAGKELPDGVFEEAGRLAAYYSKGRGSDKVEIDYVLRKEIKKPKASPPGFVVYYTNYSMTIDSDVTGIEQVEGV
ncbi:fibronectin-binding protein A [Clostridia bacterium]|nr:fibronectin-binding protein A [Clostridia bacterium]